MLDDTAGSRAVILERHGFIRPRVRGFEGTVEELARGAGREEYQRRNMFFQFHLEFVVPFKGEEWVQELVILPQAGRIRARHWQLI